jgi:hypothetical protein
MTHSPAKFKVNKDNFFKPFLMGNMSHKCLPTGLCCHFHSGTFLLVLPVSQGNQTQWEYYTSLHPNWITGFLKVYKQLMHCFIVFSFFLIRWRQNIWPVDDFLHWNPHWWSPIMHMQLTLTAGCWTKFCMYLKKVIYLYNYYNRRYNNWLPPLLRQFLLIPKQN